MSDTECQIITQVPEIPVVLTDPDTDELLNRMGKVTPPSGSLDSIPQIVALMEANNDNSDAESEKTSDRQIALIKENKKAKPCSPSSKRFSTPGWSSENDIESDYASDSSIISNLSRLSQKLAEGGTLKTTTRWYLTTSLLAPLNTLWILIEIFWTSIEIQNDCDIDTSYIKRHKRIIKNLFFSTIYFIKCRSVRKNIRNFTT